MKVTVNFDDDELRDALQLHLEQEVSVQEYFKAAMKFFAKLRQIEASGKTVGYGDKSRFTSYNIEVSPASFLHGFVTPLSLTNDSEDVPF